MKRTALFSALVLTCTLILPAQASKQPEDAITDLTLPLAQAAPAVYPSEVYEYTFGDSPRISKVYELPSSENPSMIPTGDFDRGEYCFTLLDITRTDLSTTDSKEHSINVNFSSKSKDAEQILKQLAPTKTVTTEDGYTGTLTLNPSSIKTAVSGYGTSSRTLTVKRTYPSLSDADTSFVPKTTEDSGKTLSLSNVQWQETGGYYTASATYTGTASSKYAKGYTVTASYTGEVSKTTSDTVRYTAVFGGTLIPPAPFDWSSIQWLACPIAAILVFGTLAIVRYIHQKQKGKNTV